jgi:hypothetical protein
MLEREETPVSLEEGRRILARVVRLFRPYRRRVLTVAGAILLSSGLGVLNPLLIRKIFDDALFVAGGPDMTLLWALVGTMIGVAVVASGIGVFQRAAVRLGARRGPLRGRDRPELRRCSPDRMTDFIASSSDGAEPEEPDERERDRRTWIEVMQPEGARGTWRDLPRLLADSFQLVWQAGRTEFLLTAGLQPRAGRARRATRARSRAGRRDQRRPARVRVAGLLRPAAARAGTGTVPLAGDR